MNVIESQSPAQTSAVCVYDSGSFGSLVSESHLTLGLGLEFKVIFQIYQMDPLTQSLKSGDGATMKREIIL